MLILASASCSISSQIDLNQEDGNVFTASSDSGDDSRDADDSLLSDGKGWESAAADASSWIKVRHQHTETCNNEQN